MMTQAFSPASLKKVIEYAIPKEFIPSDWSCTDVNPLVNLQSFFDKSGNKSEITVYRNPQHLLKNLQTSLNFPGFSDFFSLPDIQPYLNSPIIYSSLKNQEYVYKHDYFSFLYQSYKELEAPLEPLEQQLSDSLITLFLRQKEKLLTKNNEMAPLREENVKELKASLSFYAKKVQIEVEQNEIHMTSSQQYASFQKLFRLNDGSVEFQKLLENFPFDIEDKEHNSFFIKVFTWTALVMHSICTFMNKHRELFKVNEDLNLEHQTLTVRIFTEGKVKYVMAHELLEVMKFGGMDISKVEMEVEKMGKLGTFDFRQVFQMVGKDMSKIEFITVQKHISAYTATPIPSFNGEGYCLSSTDVFIELINNLFSVKQVARRYDWQYIRKFFDTFINEIFDSSNYQGMYFIDYEDVRRIQDLRDSYFSDRSNIADFRRYPKGHFTLDKLKSEMKHFKLDNVFEEISMEADKMKGEPAYFKGNYATSAVEFCQFRCFLRRLPKFAEFLHYQKSCEIYGGIFYCDICKTGLKLKVDFEVVKDRQENHDSSSEPVIEKNQKKKKNKKTSAGKKKTPLVEVTATSEEDSVSDQEATTPSATDSEEGQGTVVTSEVEATTLSEEHSPLIHEATTSDSSSEPVIEKNQKKKKKSKKTLLENRNEKKPEEKESQRCQKCSRTSEMCQKALKDVKILKTKNKKLEKDLKKSENEKQQIKEELLEVKNAKQIMEEEFQKMMEQMKKAQEEQAAEIEKLKKLLASKTQPEESKEPEEEELGDLECLICHDDMDDIKDTLKCQNCSRRYHKDCLVGWFEKSRSCPVCDSEFEEGIEN